MSVALATQIETNELAASIAAQRLRVTTILERRIEVLERGAHAEDSGLVIVRQIVSPGDLEPKNSFCQIDGVSYTRTDDESPANFDARMLGLAEDRCRQVGHPIRLIRSPINL